MEEDTKYSRHQSANMDIDLLQSSSTLDLVLLPTILQEKEKVKQSSGSLPEILRDCLRTAGISFHGQEALKLHHHLFSCCFASCSNHYSQTRIKQSKNDIFSSEDYLLAVIDTKLQWFPFFRELLPYLRISVVNTVLSSFVDFFYKKIEKTPLSAMEICLVSSSLEMFGIIFFDLLPLQDGKFESESDVDDADSEEDFRRLIEELSKFVTQCWQFLTESLRKEETLYSLRSHSCAVEYVVDVLSFSLVLLNPFESQEDIINFLEEVKQETVWTDAYNQSHPPPEMKEIKINIVKVDPENYVSGHENSTTKRMQDHSYYAPKVREKAERGLLNHQMLSALHKSSLESEVFFESISFLFSCDKELFDNFKGIKDQIDSHNYDVKIGHYILRRQCIFSYIKEKLFSVLENSEKEGAIKFPRLEELKCLVNNSKGNFGLISGTDDVETRIQDFQEASGLEESFQTLRKAVDNRETYWQELLSQGMQKTDMENWWKAGFYDLVMAHIDWLSSETNTAQIAYVLHDLSQRDVIIESNVKSMTQLFTVMFNKLPLLLQERLVFSSLDVEDSTDGNTLKHFARISSCHALVPGKATLQNSIEDNFSDDLLANLKSEEQVRKDLTPLLNKLTIKNVPEIASAVLKLCLYQSCALFRRILQVAIKNEGQILPVVEMLRQIRSICTSPVREKSQSRLMHCFLGVLSKISMQEKEIENVITLITQFCMDYTQVLDLKRGLTQHCPGIFKIEDVMSHLICPGFDDGFKMKDGESREEKHVLSTTVSLLCLTSVFKSVKLELFDEMNVLVLIRAVIELFCHNYSISCIQTGNEQNLEIKQRAYTCIEVMVEKLCENKSFLSDTAITCLQEQIMGDFLPTALIYPLLYQRIAFKMTPIFERIALSETKAYRGNAYQVLILFIQMGIVNELTCRDVCDFFHNIKVIVRKNHITSYISHMLSQSLPCQMSRLFKIIMAIFREMDMKDFHVGLGQESVAKETHPYMCYTEMLSDGLLLLHNRNVPDVFLRHFVSNFQAGIQAMLSNIDHKAMPELHYFIFYNCCLILSSLQGDACQAVHVMAISMLNHWASHLRQKNQRQGADLKTESKVKQSRKKVASVWTSILLGESDHVGDKKREEGMEGAGKRKDVVKIGNKPTQTEKSAVRCNENAENQESQREKEASKGVDPKKDDKEQEVIKEAKSQQDSGCERDKEDLVRLRCMVVSIKDGYVRGQLLKQLDTLSDLV